MAFKFLKHKWQRVVAIVLLSITGLILILGFLVNLYWSPILASKVKDVVLKSSDSLYTVEFSSADLHVLRGTIVIFNIVLKPDTAIYNRKKKQHLAPNNLVEFHVKRLTLSHIHPFRLYFQHKLDIGEIILNSPSLNISYQLNHTKDTVLKDNRTAWQKISKSLHSIHVGSIILGDVKFKYEDYSGNKVAVSELKQMNVSASDLLIDSATQTDKSRLLYCRDIVAELNDYQGKTTNDLYTYTIKYLKLSTLKSQLNVVGFTLAASKPEAFFNKTEADRFTLRVDSMQLNNFDFLNYHKYRTLDASSFVVKTGAIELFKNPNRKQDLKTDKVNTFPNVMLSKVSTALKIDTVRIKNLNVHYTEYNVKSHKTGTLIFNNTSGRIFNVTNNRDALLKNNISTAQLTSYFMGEGRLDVLLTFNLTDSDKTYSYKGSLGPMDLQVVNKVTRPLGMIKISSGTLKRFDFDMHANRNIAKGSVKLLYNNLKVSLLKVDSADNNNLKKRTIASLFANVFIIKHDNPDDAGKPPRSFYITYARPITSPFFKTIWHTLLEGIKPSAGLDKKTQEATTAMIKAQASNKEQRQIKKELRKQKREARRKKREEKKLNESKAEPENDKPPHRD